jgi:hypothetical protein
MTSAIHDVQLQPAKPATPNGWHATGSKYVAEFAGERPPFRATPGAKTRTTRTSRK